jgi:hypothetical protein
VRLAIAAALVLAACQPPPPKARPTIENRTVEDLGSRGRGHVEYPDGPITEESLAQFLSWRFERQLSDQTFEASYNETQEDVIDELDTMGIRTIHELAAIIPDDFEERGAGEFVTHDPANIPGLVRDFMMIHDPDRYFDRAWKNRWQSILPENVSALSSYVNDFRPFYDAGVLTPQEVEDAQAVARERRSRPRTPGSDTTVEPY